MNTLPYFSCDNEILNRAYRLAVACVAANTISIRTGVLEKELPCVMAGMDYVAPWTRDASINVFNAVALMDPEVAENTLKSVLVYKDGKIYIGDQYWDKIIWAIGAYRLWQVNGSRAFLAYAFEVLKNTMEELEKNEFDASSGLFRGAAVYGDGVSAYPPRYRNPDLSSGILDWPRLHPDLAYPKGEGNPMKTLSTNCVYARAYQILSDMAQILGLNMTSYQAKADAVKDSINLHFWNKDTGRYDYLCGESDAQEGMGLAFSILFDIASPEQAASIADNVQISKYGMPCVFPCFEPYKEYGVGRHCGTVWPHIQGFWANAMLKCGRPEKFEHELFALAKNAVRDQQFAEIYHPETGEIYGGVQEWDGQYVLWNSCSYQTWSATAFLSMIFGGVAGIRVNEEIQVKPYLPKGVNHAQLSNLYYRGKRLTITINRDEQGTEQAVTNIRTERKEVDISDKRWFF